MVAAGEISFSTTQMPGVCEGRISRLKDSDRAVVVIGYFSSSVLRPLMKTSLRSQENNCVMVSNLRSAQHKVVKLSYDLLNRVENFVYTI